MKDCYFCGPTVDCVHLDYTQKNAALEEVKTELKQQLRAEPEPRPTVRYCNMEMCIKPAVDETRYSWLQVETTSGRPDWL